MKMVSFAELSDLVDPDRGLRPLTTMKAELRAKPRTGGKNSLESSRWRVTCQQLCWCWAFIWNYTLDRLNVSGFMFEITENAPVKFQSVCGGCETFYATLCLYVACGLYLNLERFRGQEPKWYLVNWGRFCVYIRIFTSLIVQTVSKYRVCLLPEGNGF